jgi:hypothetical protein
MPPVRRTPRRPVSLRNGPRRPAADARFGPDRHRRFRYNPVRPDRRSQAMMHEYENQGPDVADHQRTFEGFIRFWVYVFGAAVAVLVFLALFNS